MKNFFLFLLLLIMKGVFGDADDEVSVNEGDPVTLHTGLTEIQRNDVIDWRFGPESDRIARINRPANIMTTYDDVLDGKFRARLKLDNQTGSLTITNIKITDSGVYKVTFSSAKVETFSLNVKPADAFGSISVKEQDSVTLHTDTKIQRDDVIQWRFNNFPVAEINREAVDFNTHDDVDNIFRHQLQLNCLSGSLTINNIGTKHSGHYEVDISSRRYSIHKTFSVIVKGELPLVSVMEKETFTLNSDTELQRDDFLQWMFRNTPIAEISKTAQKFSTYDGDDKNFKDRLELNQRTGLLSITDAKTSDSGLYELKINSSRRTINRKITVTVSRSDPSTVTKVVISVCVCVCVCVLLVAFVLWMIRNRIRKLEVGQLISETVGAELSLKTAVNEIYKDENIKWRYRGFPIAEIKGGTMKIPKFKGSYKKFESKLNLNNDGSLIITNSGPEHTGLYQQEIIRSGKILMIMMFSVLVSAEADEIENVSVERGKSAFLDTKFKSTEIQRDDDEILWVFGLKDTVIAAIKGGTKKIYRFAADGRFICRLKLDHQTGSLTITNTRTTDSGLYILQSFKSGNSSLKLFRVKITDPPKPETVPLTHVETSSS